MDDQDLYLKYFKEVLELLGDHGSVGILIIQNGVIHLTDNIVNILEYSKEEIKKWTINDFFRIIHPKSHNLLFKEIQKFQNKEISIVNLELQIVTKNLTNKYIQFIFKQLFENNNQIDIIIIKNNTEFKKKEIELKKSENQLKAILDNAPDVISRFDREIRHVYVSPAIEKLTGLPASYYIGKKHNEMGISSFSGNVMDNFIRKCFNTGSIESLIVEFPTEKGHSYFQMKVAPEYNEEGIIESVLCITRDVTKEVKIQCELNTLKGLIPICASCHKIRDDKGSWTMLEKYISENSGSEFTHGLCPDCIKKLYPEINLDEIDINNSKNKETSTTQGQ